MHHIEIIPMVIENDPIRPREFVALLHYLQQCGKITKKEANDLYHSMFHSQGISFEKETKYIHEKRIDHS